jgi:glycosyltransferase involved in cell wall biosynthesis
MNAEVSAYLPCYNNEATILQAVQSIQNQTVPVSQLFVVDDASTDNSVALLEKSGVQVISNALNEGRGAVRAKAMLQADHEFVLCCDAGAALSPNFVERALPWFAEDNVVSVQGRIIQPPPKNVVDRWRGRHLFKLDAEFPALRKVSFYTSGAIVRKSIILDVGNYRTDFRYGEDQELGARLLANGYDSILDPDMVITATAKNNLWQVLERYSRWHAPIDRPISWRDYMKLIAYTYKVMVFEDLQSHDPASILITLLCPHYQFWHAPKKRAALPFSTENKANSKDVRTSKE